MISCVIVQQLVLWPAQNIFIYFLFYLFFSHFWTAQFPLYICYTISSIILNKGRAWIKSIGIMSCSHSNWCLMGPVWWRAGGKMEGNHGRWKWRLFLFSSNTCHSTTAHSVPFPRSLRVWPCILFKSLGLFGPIEALLRSHTRRTWTHITLTPCLEAVASQI